MNWAKIPSLAALRAFEAAARCQNFSKAARELNVTPAAVAHHVRSLEADFSESLIVRQGRGVAVTSSGQILAEHLQKGFGVIADGIDQLRSQS
jgi:LysR family glycine cleavage system transcriptional activator